MAWEMEKKISIADYRDKLEEREGKRQKEREKRQRDIHVLTCRVGARESGNDRKQLTAETERKVRKNLFINNLYFFFFYI